METRNDSFRRAERKMFVNQEFYNQQKYPSIMKDTLRQSYGGGGKNLELADLVYKNTTKSFRLKGRNGRM